jgi:four helix bundle protein
MQDTKGFRKLLVWQRAYQLTLEIYKVTKQFPREETYGLVSQMQRAAVSVPANIAEGHDRNHRKEYLQFLHIAKGSLAEVETFLSLASDLGYLDKQLYTEIENRREETGKMLNGLIKSLT